MEKFNEFEEEGPAIKISKDKGDSLTVAVIGGLVGGFIIGQIFYIFK